MFFLVPSLHVVSNSLLLQPKRLERDARGKFKLSKEISSATATVNIPQGSPHKVAKTQAGSVKDEPVTGQSFLLPWSHPD